MLQNHQTILFIYNYLNPHYIHCLIYIATKSHRIQNIENNASCPLCGNNIEQVYATTLPDGAVRVLTKY